METPSGLEDNYLPTFHSPSTSTPISNYCKLVLPQPQFDHFILPLVSMQGGQAKACEVGRGTAHQWAVGFGVWIPCSWHLPHLSPPAAPLTYYLV